SAGSLQYCLQQLDKRLVETIKILMSLEMQEKYRAVMKNSIQELFKHSWRIAEQYDVPLPSKERMLAA
ncbi:MAG: hypothetical protein K8I00_12950, partial [Candidatus Omnitrophica bacterium]|nr:hypothetical protein [Candidatus Omnitrophota bacterium]